VVDFRDISRRGITLRQSSFEFGPGYCGSFPIPDVGARYKTGAPSSADEVVPSNGTAASVYAGCADRKARADCPPYVPCVWNIQGRACATLAQSPVLVSPAYDQLVTEFLLEDV